MPDSIEQAIRQATQLLTASGSDSARLDAEILLASILQKDRTFLRTWPEHTLTTAQEQQFQAWLARRQQGEPIAYITGRQGFWSLDLTVTEATLIPRPETELLVEQALSLIPANECWRIIDLGTGSGAIALALAKERPQSQFIATDIHFKSLQLAAMNASRHRIHNVDFVAANWLTPFQPDLYVDMVVSNPPYIMNTDPHLEQGDVRFEPRRALIAGTTGLDDIQIIIQQAYQHLKAKGWLLIEHGYHQANQVQQLMAKQDFHSIKNIRDYNQQPRITLAQKGENR